MPKVRKLESDIQHYYYAQRLHVLRHSVCTATTCTVLIACTVQWRQRQVHVLYIDIEGGGDKEIGRMKLH